MQFFKETYLISPLFLLLIIAGFIGIWLSIFLYRRRDKRSVIFLSFWALATGIWSLTYAMEFSAVDVASKIFWSKLSYFGIVYSPISFFFFTLAYSSRLKYLKKKFVSIVYAISTFFILSPITNELHHLHWSSISIHAKTNATEYEYGIFFWLFFVFTYFFLFSGIVNLYLLYFKFPSRYKSQIGIFIIATLFPIAGNILYVFNFNPIPGFDWTPLAFLISCILLSINIFRYGAFNLVPFARNRLFDVMPDSVMVIDRNGLVADINPAMLKLLQKNEDEVIGKVCPDIFPSWMPVIVDSEKEKSNQINLSVGESNEKKFYTIQNTALHDDKGNHNGNLINIRDVSKQKTAELNLQKINKKLKNEIVEKERLIVDLDAFAHTVAHDLKNMLGAIVTSNDLLKTSIKEGNTEEIAEIIELLELSSRKTLHITQELLLLASVRQQEIKIEKLEMCEIVNEAIKRNQKAIKDSKAQLHIPDNCMPAMGYGPWVEEVWANYISNAIKYGGNPPVIIFGFEETDNNMVKYWIKDNGNGVNKMQQHMLFAKFTRLENLKIEGHGLGLSIVKRIIDKLGGEVGLESTGKAGEGAMFYFTLPAN